MSIRLAMIGAGAMAREHLRAFGDIAEVTLAGIHSRTRDKAEALAQEFSVSHVCADVDELYEKTKADLVVVAVPELAARPVSFACFEQPWSVLMEKPAGYNLRDAQAILVKSLEKDRRVWVGLNRRFLASTQAAFQDLRTNPGSRLIYVQDQQSLETAKIIGHPQEVVDNWMYANSIHLIDYLRFFGRGGVTSVQTVWPWQGDDTQSLLAVVEFDSGDRGIYEGIWQGPGPWAVTVTTPGKRWEMRPLEKACFQNAGERCLQDVASRTWDEQFKPGFRMQAEEVVKAVRGESSLAPTLAEATDTMQLIEQIFRQQERVVLAA